MDWLKINRKKLPNNEILCANFKPHTYGYQEKMIGYVRVENDIVLCENEWEILENVTHYIDLHAHNI